MGKFLSQVTRGVLEKKPLAMLFGVPGVGKTTLACSAENSVIIPVEDGSNQINVHARMPQPKTFVECRDMVQELLDEPHDCKTLVIDTADALEALIFKKVCEDGKGDTIGKAHGGYGNGYQAAVDIWRDFLALLERLREKRQMTVILLAHSTVKTFHDPGGPDYDKYIPKMDRRGWEVLFEKSDAVLFAQYEIANTSTDSDEKGKAKATGKRVLRTCQGGAWEAKNRFGLPPMLPMNLENGWAVIAERLDAPKKLRAEIESTLTGKSPELQATVRAWLQNVGNNAAELTAGLERLKAKIADADAAKAEEKKEKK